MLHRDKLALYYFLSAIGLFGLGYGVAWFSEQPLFSAEVFPRKVESSPTPTASPSPSETVTPAVKPAESPSTKPGKQYTVKSGDTISSIAESFGVNWQDLAKYNSIPYPYNLTAGQVIIIPIKE